MSSRFEGFGMVLIEAMACGLPVISFNCPDGPSDIITDGEDGFLVENGNIETLADKICYLIENEGLRMKMGQNARESVKRYFPDEIMNKWITLFETLKNEPITH
jgi:glycosyltransferase involved in cell wall biosynthesis